MNRGDDIDGRRRVAASLAGQVSGYLRVAHGVVAWAPSEDGPYDLRVPRYIPEEAREEAREEALRELLKVLPPGVDATLRLAGIDSFYHDHFADYRRWPPFPPTSAPRAGVFDGSREHIRLEVAKRLGLDVEEVKITCPAPGAVRVELPSATTSERCLVARQWLEHMVPGAMSIEVVRAPDPVASRAEVRRAIDRLLAADRAPFATARRRAVVGFCEDREGRSVDVTPQEVTAMLGVLDAYEGTRGGARVPSPDGFRAAGLAASRLSQPWMVAVQVYESARGMQ